MTTDVVIAGAGPNGLMLACELALAGVRPIVLDKLPAASDEPKANGMLGQVVRLVDHCGLYERLSGQDGPPRPNNGYFVFASMTLDVSMLPESPLYAIAKPQQHIQRIMEERAAELDIDLRRRHELVGLTQDDDGVTVEVDGPDGRYSLRTKYLVGADGAHSRTRKLAGIGFPGITHDRTTLRMAHVTLPPDLIDPTTGAIDVPGHGPMPPFIGNRTRTGGFNYAPMPGRPAMIATSEWDQAEPDGPLTLDELRASIRRVLGADLPFDPPAGDGPHLLRRMVGGNNRVADRFRDGRVFLVGDAAHVFSGGGAFGLNLGMNEAANLAWKLAATVKGTAADGLLDTYDPERRPCANRAIMFTHTQLALLAPGDDVTGLRDFFAELLQDQNTVQRIADLYAGTDVSYQTGDHPLVGRFVPELRLDTPQGTVRLAELTRTARPLLIDLTEDHTLSADLVDVVTARCEDAPATAILLRPDCYVAWASSSQQPDLAGLHAAIAKWFGPVPVPAGS